MNEASEPNVGTQLQLRPDAERAVTRAKPRLTRPSYVRRRTYHVTLITNKRAPLFETTQAAIPFLGTLLEVAERLDFGLQAYCFMPDHVHVLLQGRSVDCNLLRFVQRYKQITSYHFKRATGDTPWQQSFFDRVLRSDEDRDAVARYIFDNPQTDGLSMESLAYKLRGGELYKRLVAADGAEAASLHSSVEPGGNYD